MEELLYIVNSKNSKESANKKNKSSSRKNMSKLHHYNSDTDFIISTEKEKRKINRKHLIKKTKIEERYETRTSKNKNPPYKRGVKIKKIIKKNKNELSNFIQKSQDEVELFGNQRYNRCSPYLFVEDLKNQLPEKIMGLVPLPSKKHDEKESLKEPQDLYDIQRNISMTRRYQYVNYNDKR